MIIESALEKGRAGMLLICGLEYAVTPRSTQGEVTTDQARAHPCHTPHWTRLYPSRPTFLRARARGFARRHGTTCSAAPTRGRTSLPRKRGMRGGAAAFMS